MKQQSPTLLRFPGSLLWLLPLIGLLLLFWNTDTVGSVWWYIAIPALVACVLIELFTTVWFGITILVLLFFYCSIGSSGVPISFAIWEPSAWVNLREMPGLEMTEFEWFHWWPFKWLVAILCLNMSIVTIRRIPLNILTAGVWTIHIGVVVMVIGSVVYFSQKIEGDVLVSRRNVVIQVQGGDPVSMVVTPSNTIEINGTSFAITDIKPNWELLSGDDIGKKTYAVTISVDSQDESFMRQLIAGYPEYTEDIIGSDDPNQPMSRAKNVLGTALVDETLQMSLEYDAKDTFYVTQSGAIYVRGLSPTGVPETEWQERPISKLPRFNDYISGYDEVRIPGTTGIHDAHAQTINPLTLRVPPQSEDDPIEGDLIVSSYLRYAFMDSQTTGGGTELFPTVWVTLRKGNEAVQSLEMYAFDPQSSTADVSLMTYKWLANENELNKLKKSLSATLFATVGGEHIPLQITNNPEFQPIGDSTFSYRIQSIQNNLAIGNNLVSLAQVELKNGEKTWVRWVFDNPEMNRDVVEGKDHDGANFIDDSITMEYSPGSAPITIVGGIEDGKHLLLTALTGDEPTETVMEVGSVINLTPEVTITLDKSEAYAITVTKPTIVPAVQRDPSASNMYSMVQVVIPSPDGTSTVWLPYHHYPFESEQEAVRRFQFKPTALQLPNGKIIEMMFSRRSAKLDAPVVLDSFEVDSHLGGFTGRTSSILNWRSLIKFLDGSEDTIAVSVNDPKPHGDFWFFQSQWDPPDSASQGLNYTVLGVGNRHGIFPMLFGCCLTVAGMIWAFYVKPTIKRKRQQASYAEVAS